MPAFNTAAVVRSLTLALLIPAVACSKKDDAVVVDTAAMMPPAMPAPTALSVSSIETGEGLNADMTLRDGTDDFGVRDTIYVLVKTEGSATGSKLAAKWTFQDGQTVEESSQDISPAGGSVNHEFHMQKATPWPAGKYKVKIMLDGVSAGTKDFEIK